MRVLLINSPIRLDAKPSCIPYGLAIIAGTLRQAGHTIDLYDINALRPSQDVILDTLRAKSWDIVGVSGLITTYKFQSWLIPHLRTINPNGIIVQGGGLATSNPELCTADYVIKGEGELPMLDLCNGGFPHERNVADLDDIAFPAWGLLPMEIYLNNPIWGNSAGNSSGFLPGVKVHRSINVISSRGCPFSCSFCFHLFGPGNYRMRSPENVVAEIEILVNRYGVDFVGFVDDNMMVSREWMERFCRLVKDFKINWGCHGRVASAKPEVVATMAASGCVWIGYGCESGSQGILGAMHKLQTVQQAKDAVINTRRAGIFPNTTFITGWPGENEESIQETIRFKQALDIHCGSFFCTPYPQTRLYEMMKHKIPNEIEYISKLGNATSFVLNCTDMPDKELFRLKTLVDGC